MKNIIIFFLHVSIFLLTWSCSNYSGKIAPKPVKGFLDLSDWDFEKDGSVNLRGEWEFYWEQLLRPGDFKNKVKPKVSTYIKMPSFWNGLNINDKKLTEDGFATYRLNIKTKKYKNPDAIYIRYQRQNYKIFINDQEIARAGNPGRNFETSKAKRLTQFKKFDTSEKTIQILMQISNFRESKAGAFGIIKIGSEKDISQYSKSNIFIDLFIFGSLFVMGLYHVVIYFLRKDNLSAIYLGIFCLIISFRSIVINETMLVHVFPDISSNLHANIIYLTVFLPAPFLFKYFHTIFKKEISSKIINFSFISFIAYFALFVSLKSIKYTLNICLLILLLYFAYIVFSIIIAIKRNKNEAFIILCGTIIIFLTAINDMLVENQVIRSGLMLLPFGLFIFLFSQYYLLGRRFAIDFKDKVNATNKLEELNKNLERKVEERTEELQASNSELEAINIQLIETRDALWGEMETAKKLQTVLLPGKPAIKGYEISAYMKPAVEVGGDYYDIINAADRDWLIIGDVSGHGLPAGLIMMMVQTSINTAIQQNPEITPSKLLNIINKTINKNIKKLNEDKYMTITVFAVLEEGRFAFSGLHQEILIYRKNNQYVEIVKSDGVWIGLFDEIEDMLQNDELSMEDGDMMLLFTDGITEAWLKGSVKNQREASSDMFGSNKLVEIFQQHGEKSPEEVVKSILQAMEGYDTDDDVTIVVLKKI